MEALVQQAETALLRADFTGAEAAARQAVKASPPASDAAAVHELRDRACVVALQSLYETQRFGLAHRLLKDLFGSAAEAPPNSLLLWLALALDTEGRREAERLIQALLDDRQPATADAPTAAKGWSRRQYLALLHLYTTEMLLRELREPAAVMRWVRETSLPVTGEERQLLLAELEEESRQLARSPSSGGSSPGREAAAAAARAARELAPTWPAAGGEAAAAQQEAGEADIFTQQQQQPAAAERGAGSEIAPAAAECAPDGAASELGLDWLGRWQHAALQLVRPLLPVPPAPAPLAGAGQSQLVAPPGTLRQLVGAAVGATLLYALYAERRALKRGLGAAQRLAGGGAGDLVRMALHLSVNPLA